MIRVVIAWTRLNAESLPGTVSTTVMDGADKGDGCPCWLSSQKSHCSNPSKESKERPQLATSLYEFVQ
jgi:hypothetical protein